MVAGAGKERTYNSWLLALLLLSLAVVLLYWPVSGHDFLNYDDQINIYENELVTRVTAGNISAFWLQPYKNLYIPLTYNAWQVQSALSQLFPGETPGPNPHLFHLVNLLFHLLNTALVFTIIRRLLKSDGAAAAGALLFAVHPVQVEVVAWATGFKDLFSGCWSLLAIWQYLRYRGQVEEGEAGGRGHYLLAGLFLLAALLAKPSAVTVPLVMLLLAFWEGKRLPAQVARELGPFFLLALPFAVVTKLSQPDAVAALLPSWGERLLICGDTFWFYLGQLFFPLTVGPDYGRTPQLVLAGEWRYLTGVLPYLLLAGLLWRGGLRWRLAAGIFAVSLLPVSGLIFFIQQVTSTVADRYLYLPMLGAGLGVGLLLQAWPRRAVLLAVYLLLLLLGLRSVPLVQAWRDSISFNEYALKVNPESWGSHNNLGMALRNTGQLNEAYRHFAEAARILPRFEIAYNNMGGIQELSGKSQEAAGLYLQAIRVNPDFLMGYDNYVRVLLRRGNLAAGMQSFAQALAGHPQAAIAYQHFGTALLNGNRMEEASRQLMESIRLGNRAEAAESLLGDALAGLGQRVEAVSHYRQALALNPRFAEAYNGLALLQMQQGEFAPAVENFREALRVRPEMLQARGNLAVALSLLGRNREAGEEFAAILRIFPDSAEAHNGLGMVLLAAERAAEAVPHFQAALRLQPDQPEVRKNLAEALARQQGGK